MRNYPNTNSVCVCAYACVCVCVRACVRVCNRDLEKARAHTNALPSFSHTKHIQNSAFGTTIACFLFSGKPHVGGVAQIEEN